MTDPQGSSFNPDADNISSQVSQVSQDPAADPAEPPTPETSTAAMLVRQHSTTEYLPGMLHTNSPPGLLPKFPSWSLMSLGKYSSYSPTQGLWVFFGVFFSTFLFILKLLQIHICSPFRFSILYYNNVVGGRCWYFKVKFIKSTTYLQAMK